MSRPATILIMIAMIVTACSVSIVLYVQFAMPAGQSIALGVAALFGLALVHVQMERRRDKKWLEERLAEAATDMNVEIARVTTKIVKLDQAIGQRVHRESEPLAAEVEVLGHLMKQIAETVANLEVRVDDRMQEISARAEQARLAPPQPAPAPPVEPSEPVAFQPAPRAPARPAAPQEEVRIPVSHEPARMPSAFEREVEAAIRGERIEMHLQPIVTLPQRKVRYYEVLTRLRGNDGRLVTPTEFLVAAEARRVVPKLDTYQVIRSFQILKRLVARNGEIGLFVNLSIASLVDTAFFREFQTFLGQNRQMADLVQFEFTQDAVREMGPVEAESLKALSGLGYRYSVDNITDLRMDFRSLADQGFRTAKIAADRLLGRIPTVTGDIHPADLAGHLQRQGLSLIVDRIETESQVIDLLDYEVRLAQGHLFSAPRQVRPEILGAAPAASPAPEAAPAPAAARGGAGR